MVVVEDKTWITLILLHNDARMDIMVGVQDKKLILS